MQTQAGTLLGTPSYMSPEQCMARPVDARTDVYALGIILFEMCTGRVPFIGEGYADLLIKQINGELPSPRSINPALSIGIERVIARALEKDPANRFQSMEEFQAALASPSQLGGAIQNMVPVTSDSHNDSTVLSGNVPTTLQGAASEMRSSSPTQMGAAPKRRGVGAVLGVIAGLAVAGGVLGFVLLKDNHATAGDTTGPGDTPATGEVAKKPDTKEEAPAKKMRLHVGSDPGGAIVKKEDGTELGKTPLDTELPADGSMLKLIVHLDGFKDEVRAVILTDRDKTLAFRMTADKKADKKPDEPEKKHHSSGSSSSKPKDTKDKKNVHLGDDILAPQL
jgi:serine/threonine-protein kinase